MATKRGGCCVDYDSDSSDGDSERISTSATTPAAATAAIDVPQAKRQKMDLFHLPKSTKVTSTSENTTGRDFLSALSDELLVRILSFLPLKHLLAVTPVSRKFYHLAGDSQLWKALYYARFVLPRAMMIPGFRDGVAGTGAGHKLHYTGRRTLWADGRRGGVVDDGDERLKERKMQGALGNTDVDGGEKNTEAMGRRPAVNWKRQFKIRYNWSKGKCAVEELRIGDDGGKEGRKMIAKVVEGIAITADEVSGLRAWDLKSRKLLAQIATSSRQGNMAPSCIAIDEKQPDEEVMDIAIGFSDGSFGVWRFFTGKNRLGERYRHEKSSNGELAAMAFSYPYLLTATESVLISLYTFDLPDKTGAIGAHRPENARGRSRNSGGIDNDETGKQRQGYLPPPYLLTSLQSHTSRSPLALSIRKTAVTTIATIAYTFSTLQGWLIGVQDLHIRPSKGSIEAAPEISTTRIAYTTPMDTGHVLRVPPTHQATRRRRDNRTLGVGPTVQPSTTRIPPSPEPGPTNLCYTHPYLLATLPDNTLILYTCTSNASSLSISDGIRLWGHTSGISDAEITARGKAVSVSKRGEEMRVWELEGRSSATGSESVEIRPGQALSTTSLSSPEATALGLDGTNIRYDWEEQRNWVGFDDEMVIVLKEKKGGGESLMVYDFT